MKRIISVLLMVVLIVSLSVFNVTADEEISIVVNGEKIITDVPPAKYPVYSENGNYVGDRVMVPIRAISEKLNCDVHWDDTTHGVTIYRKNTLSIMWEGKPTAFYMNGIGLYKGYTMEIPPVIVDGRTLLPVRAVSELMGAKVEWIDETKTVDIMYDLGEIEDNAGLAEKVSVYQSCFYEQYDIYDGFVNGTIETVTGKIILADGGEIGFELYPQIAPKTCLRFIQCANQGVYDNTIFHRVIKDFVVQGGGKTTDGILFETEPIAGEFVMNGYFNMIPHKRGTISLARKEDKDSGSQQFFICQQDSPSLDGNYAAFGRVTSGMDVIDRIASVAVDENDEPITPLVVNEIVID
ncbi:MAG: peptidylprolyl isomerase [Clostridia bacterium]|nr:peptidylprolyl isomerase [Clostridia bacterium]